MKRAVLKMKFKIRRVDRFGLKTENSIAITHLLDVLSRQLELLQVASKSGCSAGCASILVA